ncbi:hypothetical protein S40293_05858 [Stachybotrys chartarum IBT 40293]|nr:hypothetical protein S40293_05858 [Stachybotrys chartarum IBT 40293]
MKFNTRRSTLNSTSKENPGGSLRDVDATSGALTLKPANTPTNEVLLPLSNMATRKRNLNLEQVEDEAQEPTLLHRIRNMWQFANLYQWIFLFGKAANIDDSLDIEDLETECLKPNSPVLDDIALAVLKLVSSHRGLTHEILDSQARKQYLRYAPSLNPFGDGEEPVKFSGFDVITKIRVLQQLTQWTMIHPERIRDKMEETKDMEQTSWRIEPYGWDSEDRTYFVLDDNRVYRLTESAPTPAPLYAKRKAHRAGRRSSKRRRGVSMGDPETDLAEDEGAHQPLDDGLGGMAWQCLAVSLEDVRTLLQTFDRTRDENEKTLRKQLENHLIPILERQEASRKRKELQREREQLNMAKMANAKRSSRLAGKAERRHQEESAKEEEQRLRAAEAAARHEELQQRRMEQARDLRMHSRAQRLKERDARRLQHEEELAQLSEDSKGATSGTGRISERRRQIEIERNQQALKELEQDEDDWIFDCVCGVYGQVDDGTHSVACEVCNVWQHSKCLGISESDADRPDFHFICSACRHQQEKAKTRPKTTIRLKVGQPQDQPSQTSHTEPPHSESRPSSALVVELPAKPTISQVADRSGQTPTGDNMENSTDVAVSYQTPSTTIGPSISTHAEKGRNKPNDLPDRGEAERNSEPDEPSSSNLYQREEVGMQDALRQQQQESYRFTPPNRSQKAATPFETPLQTKETPKSHGGMSLTGDGQALGTELYTASFVRNGTTSPSAGLSPTKHVSEAAGQLLHSSPGASSALLTPATTLLPSPRQLILTPPTKPSGPRRSSPLHNEQPGKAC